MLFFREVSPPHTSDNIRIKFEDELDCCRVKCFMVVTDNAANMKSAFQINADSTDSHVQIEEVESSDDEDSSHEEVMDVNNKENGCFDDLGYWSPQPLDHFDGWIGCAAHQLQLVVQAGYKELMSYRRVQTAFNKCKSICTLSRQSSDFKYKLSSKIPVPNDTQWNSYFRLHQHILRHVEEINKALDQVGRSALCLSTADKDSLSKVVEVMSYFAEATDILQAEEKPTINRVIPVIDSLENALESINKDSASINALCQCLLNSLESRFSYLIQSAVHLAATALDPRIKLSFSDNFTPGKRFVFDSSVVKRKLKELLPAQPNPQVPAPVTTQPSTTNAAKRPRLLDFSSVPIVAPISSSGVDTELQTYLDQPRVQADPILFWAERNTTSLSTLALQLFSIPCSSAPVERLFSKAGFVLNQRRTRLSSSRLEQLLFFK